MILARGKRQTTLFLYLGIGISFLALFFIPVSEEAGEPSIYFAAPREIHVEQPLPCPPVYFWAGEHLHYLGITTSKDKELKYLILNDNLETVEERNIPIPATMDITFAFPIGMQGTKAVFGLISREERIHQPYRLYIDPVNTHFQALDISISRHHAMDSTLFQDRIIHAYVERKNGEYRLWLQEQDQEALLIEVCQEFLGLPRLVVDEQGLVHLQWKGSQNGRGRSYYQSIDSTTGAQTLETPMNLGPASYYFGTIHSSPIYYEEDPGAHLFLHTHGTLYCTWTDSTWDTELNILRSSLYLVKISPEGEKLGKWQIQQQGFQCFATLFSSHEHSIDLIYEEYANGKFTLMHTTLNTLTKEFSQARQLTNTYSNQRLPRAGQNPRGDYSILAREIQGLTDSIWGISSKQRISSSWYQRANLWFSTEGPPAVLREGTFLLLYSLISALGSVSQNILSLILITIILYSFRKIGVLDRLDFFTFLGSFIIFFTLCRNWFPFLYQTVHMEQGTILYSSLMATIIVLLMSRKSWENGGDELEYMYYVFLWMFADAFFQHLIIAPLTFLP